MAASVLVAGNNAVARLGLLLVLALGSTVCDRAARRGHAGTRSPDASRAPHSSRTPNAVDGFAVYFDDTTWLIVRRADGRASWSEFRGLFVQHDTDAAHFVGTLELDPGELAAKPATPAEQAQRRGAAAWLWERRCEDEFAEASDRSQRYPLRVESRDGALSVELSDRAGPCVGLPYADREVFLARGFEIDEATALDFASLDDVSELEHRTTVAFTGGRLYELVHRTQYRVHLALGRSDAIDAEVEVQADPVFDTGEASAPTIAAPRAAEPLRFDAVDPERPDAWLVASSTTDPDAAERDTDVCATNVGSPRSRERAGPATASVSVVPRLEGAALRWMRFRAAADDEMLCVATVVLPLEPSVCAGSADACGGAEVARARPDLAAAGTLWADNRGTLALLVPQRGRVQLYASQRSAPRHDRDATLQPLPFDGAVPERAPVRSAVIGVRSIRDADAARRAMQSLTAPMALMAAEFAAQGPWTQPVPTKPDAAVQDAGDGRAWGNHCFAEFRAARYTAAQAACEFALSLATEPKVRAAIYYSLARVAFARDSNPAALVYLRTSLALRDNPTARRMLREIADAEARLAAEAERESAIEDGAGDDEIDDDGR